MTQILMTNFFMLSRKHQLMLVGIFLAILASILLITMMAFGTALVGMEPGIEMANMNPFPPPIMRMSNM